MERNHSLVTANRTTHLKIVVLSLVAAIVVVATAVTCSRNDTRGKAVERPVLLKKQ